MKPNVLNSLVRWWKCQRLLRHLRKEALLKAPPSPQEVDAIIGALHATEHVAHAWPSRWSETRFEALMQTSSMLAHNMCCTALVDDYGMDFVHRMAALALAKSDTALLDVFQKRLHANTLPDDVWAHLLTAQTMMQVRMLTRLEGLPGLPANKRGPVLTILAASEPHLWLYEHAQWYRALAQAWKLPPPAHWWSLLYTEDMYRPKNPLRKIQQGYPGYTLSQLVSLTGRKTYSFGELEMHRYALLEQDPWAPVRSAFFGDTCAFKSASPYSVLNAKLTDAHAVLMQYHPEKMTSEVHQRISPNVRQGTPSLEITMHLGMPSWEEAYAAFSLWLESGSQPSPESLSVDGLL